MACMQCSKVSVRGGTAEIFFRALSAFPCSVHSHFHVAAFRGVSAGKGLVTPH